MMESDRRRAIGGTLLVYSWDSPLTLLGFALVVLMIAGSGFRHSPVGLLLLLHAGHARRPSAYERTLRGLIVVVVVVVVLQTLSPRHLNVFTESRT